MLASSPRPKGVPGFEVLAGDLGARSPVSETHFGLSGTSCPLRLQEQGRYRTWTDG